MLKFAAAYTGTMCRLDISGCQRITDRGVSMIATSNGFRNLHFLGMSHCHNISDDSLLAMARGFPMLAEVLLDRTSASDKGVRALVDDCKLLQRVQLAGCQNIDGSFSVKPTIHSGCNLFMCCSLRSISLHGCLQITSSHLCWIAQSCRFLEEIDVSDCLGVGTKGITALCKGCPLLSLNVIGTRPLSSAVMDTIAAECPSMTSLDIAGHKNISLDAFIALMQQCRRLLHLNCSGLSEIADDAFVVEATIKQQMEVLKGDARFLSARRTKMESLHLADVPHLTKSGFAAISVLYDALKVVDFSGCAQLDDVGIFHITSRKMLRVLDCNFCHRISNAGLHRICSSSPQLEVLRVSLREPPGHPWEPATDPFTGERIHDQFSEKSFAAIFLKLTNLKILECKRRRGISGHDILEHRVCCRRLRELDIEGCKAFQKRPLRLILEACDMLTTLNISGCRKLAGAQFLAPKCEGSNVRLGRASSAFKGFVPILAAEKIRRQVAFLQT